MRATHWLARARLAIFPLTFNLSELKAFTRAALVAAGIVLSAEAADAQFARPRMVAEIAGRTVAFDNYGVPKGNASAPIWIVEMADFGCGYCAKFARETLPVLDSLYTDKGQIHWRFVPFVLGMFPNAQQAAQGAVCAARQGKFWPMHDLLYENRKAWMGSKDPRKLIATYASQSRLDMKAYNECASSKSAANEVARNTALARTLNVRGTPTFVINGDIIPGALPTDVFVKGLGQMIEKAR